MGLSLNKITIEELCDKRINEITAKRYSEKTIKHYGDAKKYFLSYCKERGLIYADEVTRDHASEYEIYLRNTRGMGGNPHIGELRQIALYKNVKAIFQYAVTRNSVINNPFYNIVFPIVPVHDWWTDEYYNSLIEVIRTRAQKKMRHKYETIVRILYTTGLRVGLLLQARHENVTVTPDGRVYLTTKRKTPKNSAEQDHTCELLNKKARKMFLAYYKEGETGYMFTKGRPIIIYHVVKRGLTRLCKKTGLPYRGLHKAKHGFVTKMLLKGYTAEQICKLTGNKTPSLINQVYNHIQASDFRERVQADIADL